MTINGSAINYTATTGTQPVWDEMGEPIASLHYTYYTRNNVRDRAKRPLLISFNGGPPISFANPAPDLKVMGPKGETISLARRSREISFLQQFTVRQVVVNAF